MIEEYIFDVNGYEVKACYEKEDVEHVFKPLLNRWYSLYKKSQQRLIVFMAACPGSGKSTLVSFLEYLFKTMNFDCRLQAIGMDGFHYSNSYLESHDLKSEKGSPRTFDVEKLKEKCIQLKKEDCFWPFYSRTIHDPIDDSIYVDAQIVLIEGNYLLTDEKPWNELITIADDHVFIYTDSKECKERCIQRKAKGNLSLSQAIQWYESSDGKNIEYVLSHHFKANVELYFKNNKIIKAEYNKENG